MPKYRKRPVVVEAIQWNPFQEGIKFANAKSYYAACLEHKQDMRVFLGRVPDGLWFTLETLEGPMIVKEMDYVVRGIKGEFYPVKPDIFEATYDLVEEEENSSPTTELPEILKKHPLPWKFKYSDKLEERMIVDSKGDEVMLWVNEDDWDPESSWIVMNNHRWLVEMVNSSFSKEQS